MSKVLQVRKPNVHPFSGENKTYWVTVTEFKTVKHYVNEKIAGYDWVVKTNLGYFWGRCGAKGDYLWTKITEEQAERMSSPELFDAVVEEIESTNFKEEYEINKKFKEYFDHRESILYGPTTG